MAYPDTFNRPDGSLGAGWTVYDGAMDILSNQAHASAPAFAYATGQSEAGHQDHYAVVPIVGGVVKATRILLKKSSSSGNCLWAMVGMYGASLRASVGIILGGSDTMHGYADIAVPADSSLVLRAYYDGQFIRCYVNGVEQSSYDQNGFDAQTQFGFALTEANATLIAFDTTEASAPFLTITPGQAWFASPVMWFQAELHNATWDGPMPPQAGVYADKGFISATHLETDTIQAFEYAALGNQGTVTVTDPVTGATGTFVLTLYPPQDSGQSWPLTEDGARILNDTGEACLTGTILTTCDVVDGGAPVHITEALDAILEQLGGFPNQIGPDIGAVSLPAEIKALSLRAFDQTFWTVDQVVETLGGAPTIYSNADLLAAIGNIQTGSNQDVLDALAAYFGASPPTIEQIGTMLSDLATIAGYTLGDVRTWIEAIPPAPDLAPVTTAISNLRGGTATVQAVFDLLGAMDNKLDAIGTDLTAIRTAGSLTLQDVLDAIAAIEIPPAATYEGPPVWPGQATVTLGPALALVDDLEIIGPMHGLIFTITGQPVQPQKYMFGSVASWSRVGAVVFCSDRGDYERSQTFSLDAQVMAPQAMASAASALIRLNPGWSGTVRRWTRA